MSVSFSFLSLAWPLLAILLGSLEISIAVLLLREKGPGPKLMLGGAIMGLLGNLSKLGAMFMMNQSGNFSEAAYAATWSLTALGSLLFTIGLLLFTLHRRALTNRITELEAILASRDPR